MYYLGPLLTLAVKNNIAYIHWKDQREFIFGLKSTYFETQSLWTAAASKC